MVAICFIRGILKNWKKEGEEGDKCLLHGTKQS